MAEDNSNEVYIQGLSIQGVNRKWDYEALANLPDLTEKQDTLSDTDGGYGQRIKAIEDELAAAIDFDAQTY